MMIINEMTNTIQHIVLHFKIILLSHEWNFYVPFADWVIFLLTLMLLVKIKLHRNCHTADVLARPLVIYR